MDEDFDFSNFPRPDPADIARQDQINALSQDPALRIAVASAQQSTAAFLQRASELGMDYPTAMQMIVGAVVGQGASMVIPRRPSGEEE